MPPAMSHEFYGEKVDINCSGTGAGHQMLVCLNSAHKYSYVLCNLVTNEWIELPQCYMNGEAKELEIAHERDVLENYSNLMCTKAFYENSRKAERGRARPARLIPIPRGITT
ncbi:F-box only protein 13 [Forsythia ovata]|uniref:F-box only protein 13 n=1 Tax=Forsythia ovata TaxID=205694 RepID=A0ABD1W4X9_9LAMI